jgi:hypothetical protein
MFSRCIHQQHIMPRTRQMGAKRAANGAGTPND